jgi:hypothetical protein
MCSDNVGSIRAAAAIRDALLFASKIRDRRRFLRTKEFQFFLLFSCISSAEHHHDHHHPQDHSHLRPHTHIAYHHVESACAADVEGLCEIKQEELPQTLGDPFLDWVFLSATAPPPEIEDVSRFLDSFFSAPISQVSIYWYEEPQQAPHFMIDTAAAKLAAEKEPEEIPALAHQLQSYGEKMMQMHQEDSLQHLMGRRLTEMDATTIQHHVRLPFGCAKNRCLRDALVQNKVSDECARSMQQLEMTYELEEELELRQEVFVGMMWVYICALCILLVLLARKYRSTRVERRLRTRILQAVYSDPTLKRQIEKELGESVGSVPPLPYHVLKLMGTGGKDLKRHLLCMKRTHMVFFSLLLSLVFVAPFWVLPICIYMSMLRIVQLCLFPVRPSECECCCCGASTTDAASGNLTELQECCNCCKGTGVCAPSCASCCGPDSCCCCGCCDGSCCCNKSTKANGRDDCTCCCCGATAEQARAGTLTDAQVCCKCCKGTGTCDPSCASCCGGGGCCCCCGASEKSAKEGTLTQAQACCCCCNGTGCCNGCSCCGASTKKGRGQKHVFASNHVVYEGVPLQVV